MTDKKLNPDTHSRIVNELEDAALDWTPQEDLLDGNESQPVSLIENPTEVFLPDLLNDEDLELELSERMTESDESLNRLASQLENEEDISIKAELLAKEQAEAQATADLLKTQLEEDAALTKEQVELSDPVSASTLPKLSDIPDTEWLGAIEALLFVSDKALKTETIAKLLGAEKPEEADLVRVKTALEELKSRFDSGNHGFELVDIQGAYELRSRAQYGIYLQRLKKTQYQRLSSGAMETLAVIAYHGPVMKDGVDRIRGVDSAHFIKGLMERGLIEVIGRSEDVGRPMLYATTQAFYELFGVSSKDALPSLSEIEAMIPVSESGQALETKFERQLRENLNQLQSRRDLPGEIDVDADKAFLSEIEARVKSLSLTTPTLQSMHEQAKKQLASESE